MSLKIKVSVKYKKYIEDKVKQSFYGIIKNFVHHKNFVYHKKFVWHIATPKFRVKDKLITDQQKISKSSKFCS